MQISRLNMLRIIRIPNSIFQFHCRICHTQPPFTSARFPHIKRGPYAKLRADHLSFFRYILGEDRVLTDSHDCQPFNIDWVKNVRGQSECVLKPNTTAEVSAILGYCNDQNLAVCPQGGNTGLVAGSVPVFDEIIISMGLMNKIISTDRDQGVLVCEAGCILQTLDEYLSTFGLMMPLDLGAKGSCHIGGNVSTNAGGLRLLRYGSLHANILGIEAVLANGRIIDSLSTLKKDNTGYHLQHLFIGSEGTLGVVTKVAIQCATRPTSVTVAFLVLESFEKVLRTYTQCRRHLGEILSSFELMDASSIEAVIKHLGVKPPVWSDNENPFFVLIETHGSEQKHDAEKFEQFLSQLFENETIMDGTFSTEPSKIENMWNVRERISEATLRDGPCLLKYDLSLPLKHFYELVPIMRQRLGANAIRCCGFGHIGDGNIHLNISLKQFSEDVLSKIEPFVYEYTAKLGGSISAEHGMGLRKPHYMHFSKGPAAIELMHQFKQLLDPKATLNPYKVLPNL